MKIINTFAAVTTCGLGLLALTGTANATAVVCGNAALGTRTVTVDPAKPIGDGGYCYAQNGNLQEVDITNLGFTEISKNAAGTFTRDDEGVSGTWTIDADLWTVWKNLYIGFHFGGNAPNDPADKNPDSFIIELNPYDTTGTWVFGNGKLNGISNFYVLGKNRCAPTDDCGPPDEVPEPGTLALLGLGLLGLGLGRKRLQA